MLTFAFILFCNFKFICSNAIVVALKAIWVWALAFILLNKLCFFYYEPYNTITLFFWNRLCAYTLWIPKIWSCNKTTLSTSHRLKISLTLWYHWISGAHRTFFIILFKLVLIFRFWKLSDILSCRPIYWQIYPWIHLRMIQNLVFFIN